MKFSKSLISSIQFTIIGALPFVSALVLLPFYSNYLSTELFGLLNVYISISLLFQVLASFGIEQYVPVLFHDPEKSEAERMHYYSSALGVQLLTAVVVLGLSLLFGSLLFSWLYPDSTLEFWPYGLMSIATGVFNAYFRTETTYLTNVLHTREYSLFNLFNFVLTVVLSIVFLYMWPGEIFGPLMGRLLSGAAIFLLAFSYQRKSHFPHFNSLHNNEIIRISAVMLAYTGLMWVLNYVDRFVITGYCSLELVAIYDFATKCLLPVEFVMMGLAGFVLPRIYKSWQGNYEKPPMTKAKTLLHAYLVASVAGVFLCMLFIPPIAPFVIFNEKLFDSFSWIGLLGIVYFTRSLFSLYMGLLMLRKEQGKLVQALFFSAIVQVVLLFLLVPLLDVLGAVIALTAGRVASLLFMKMQLSKRVTLDVNYGKMITYPMIISLVLIAAFMTERTFGYYIVAAVSAGISGLVTLFFFRKDLKRAYDLIFERVN